MIKKNDNKSFFNRRQITDFELIEIDKLRDEINQRLNFQIQILSILLSGVITIYGFGIGYKIYYIVLLSPIFSIGCGLLYVSNQFCIMNIGNYIFNIEEENGWEHYIRRKVQTPKQYIIGNFYPIAVMFFLLFPLISSWTLFGIAMIYENFLFDYISLGLLISYFLVTLIFTLIVIKGFKKTLYEYN